MADTVRQIDYFYRLVPHKAGEAAKALNALKDAGVNVRASRRSTSSMSRSSWARSAVVAEATLQRGLADAIGKRYTHYPALPHPSQQTG